MNSTLCLTHQYAYEFENIKSKCVASSLALDTDLRANALSIQVEDCAQELQTWLSIARRLKNRKAGRGSKPVQRFIRFSGNLWVAFISSASRTSRISLYERLRWHSKTRMTGREYSCMLRKAEKNRDVSQPMRRMLLGSRRDAARNARAGTMSQGI